MFVALVIGSLLIGVGKAILGTATLAAAVVGILAAICVIDMFARGMRYRRDNAVVAQLAPQYLGSCRDLNGTRLAAVPAAKPVAGSRFAALS